MSKNLVIVESPAKAKTIEGYLGKDFRVLSSIGHIRSIAKKTKDGTPPIDVKHGFKTVYEIDSDKKKTIAELKKAVKEAETVWLATDEDREGEAIAWHLCEVLKLDPKKTNRIVFHEITKSAIEAAVKNPRTVDMNLVKAQQARQILDRIVGFELSPVVWQKVPGGKSAGRVQSPAVRLLVEREREIRAFETDYVFRVTAEFHPAANSQQPTETIKAELPERFETEDEARAFLESLQGATFTVSDVTKTPGTRNPAAPFTTSTLQQTANSSLGFSSKATMQAAQKLYQEGKITYMRTDSVNLSKQAMAAAASFVEGRYGKEYVKVRNFKTKSSSAQEAHEAIRPTDMTREVASSNAYDQKLYDLIRRRTLASQMAPAQLERTEIRIDLRPKTSDLREVHGTQIDTLRSHFVAKGEVVVFDGFLKVYGKNKEDNLLPALNSGDTLDLNSALARQTFSKPPARYTEGSLVKKLEELGIGRPSTYATIISTVQARGYVERGESEGIPRDVVELHLEGSSKVPSSTVLRNTQNTEHRTQNVTRRVTQEKTGADRGKLVPTPSGELIADFLGNHFTEIVDYGFTANIENHLDRIADNKLERNKLLEEFYKPFHARIESSGDIDRSSVAQARTVGTDPKTGKLILARFGRFGPMLQLGDGEGDDKPTFAPLPKGVRLEDVTIEQAMKAFELPRVVGATEDGEVIKANIGRFGPYIQIGKLFVSLKEDDPREITEEKARILYAAKLQAEAEKNIADFGDGIKVLKGRYGPYITDGKKNAKIPKDTEPSAITHDQAKKLLSEAPAKTKKRRFARKTTRRTTRKKS